MLGKGDHKTKLSVREHIAYFVNIQATLDHTPCHTMAIIDLIAIIPYYIGLMVGSGAASSLAVVRILRLARVLRLLKLSRHSPELQNMVSCFVQTWREALVFCFMVIIAIVLISSLVFYCEEGQYPDTDFTSIPATFWYGAMTVTTVGYGDMSPSTTAGKIVAAFCILFCIILLSIPASIFIAEYMRLHEIRKAMSIKWEVPPLAIAETELHSAQDGTRLLKVGSAARDEGLLNSSGKQRFQKVYMHTVAPNKPKVLDNECYAMDEVLQRPKLVVRRQSQSRMQRLTSSASQNSSLSFVELTSL